MTAAGNAIWLFGGGLRWETGNPQLDFVCFDNLWCLKLGDCKLSGAGIKHASDVFLKPKAVAVFAGEKYLNKVHGRRPDHITLRFIITVAFTCE